MPLTARGAAKNATIVRKLLTHRATVYTRTANTGPYNLVVKSGLACRLEGVQRQPAATSADRRELANIGTLRYDATYEMSGSVQIAVDAFPGVRWAPIAATMWPDDVPGIGVISRSCDVVRQL
jgi:hypothetical protein